MVCTTRRLPVWTWRKPRSCWGHDGIEAWAPVADSFAIRAGEQRVISVRLKAIGNLEPGRYVIGVRVRSGVETTVAKLHVDWLGTLSRKIIRGGGQPAWGPKLRDSFRQNVHPNREWERLHVSQGVAGGDGSDGAASYLSFHIPDGPEGLRKGSIRSARVRLYFAPAHWAMQQAVTGDPTPRKDISWGRVKQAQGAKWPELHKCNYPGNLPATKPESSPMAMVEGSGIIVEAPLPGGIKIDEKQPNVNVAIEPTGPGGAVYWGNQAPDPLMRPVLVVDYDPEMKVEAAKK